VQRDIGVTLLLITVESTRRLNLQTKLNFWKCKLYFSNNNI